MLIYKGTIGHKKAGTYQGRNYAVLQFMEHDERGMNVIDIGLPDGLDHTAFTAGVEVEVPVKVRAKDSSLSYRCLDGHAPTVVASRKG